MTTFKTYDFHEVWSERGSKWIAPHIIAALAAQGWALCRDSEPEYMRADEEPEVPSGGPD